MNHDQNTNHCHRLKTIKDDADPFSSKPSILVVENDPAVLKVLEAVLEGNGFCVRSAGGGKEAVSLYEVHRDTIDLVLMDVPMPELDSFQTIALLRELNPQIRVVFMTGALGYYKTEDLLARGAALVLEKPFGSSGEFIATLKRLACN